MDKASVFGSASLGIPAEFARSLAMDAVSFVWEECKFGRAAAETSVEFFRLVSERLYKIRRTWRVNYTDDSMDAPISDDDDGGSRHDRGWSGYAPPDQIEVTYLHQIQDGIALLPKKYSDVMARIATGENALDIAEAMRLPLHTVFRRLQEGRRLLKDGELVEMAREDWRAHSSATAKR